MCNQAPIGAKVGCTQKPCMLWCSRVVCPVLHTECDHLTHTTPLYTKERYKDFQIQITYKLKITKHYHWNLHFKNKNSPNLSIVEWTEYLVNFANSYISQTFENFKKSFEVVGNFKYIPLQIESVQLKFTKPLHRRVNTVPLKP